MTGFCPCLSSVSEPPSPSPTHLPAAFPGDSLLFEPFMLTNFVRMNHAILAFYCPRGTIGHNEVLFPSLSLGGS